LDKEIILKHIEAELNRAKGALEEGNTGMARVCARRACGHAISFWLQNNPREDYGESAMNQLKNIQNDEVVPVEIREAVVRLTTKISNRDISPFTDDPIADANIITNYFLS
jgi:hypothetical protein